MRISRPWFWFASRSTITLFRISHLTSEPALAPFTLPDSFGRQVKCFIWLMLAHIQNLVPGIVLSWNVIPLPPQFNQNNALAVSFHNFDHNLSTDYPTMNVKTPCFINIISGKIFGGVYVCFETKGLFPPPNLPFLYSKQGEELRV